MARQCFDDPVVNFDASGQRNTKRRHAPNRGCRQGSSIVARLLAGTYVDPRREEKEVEEIIVELDESEDDGVILLLSDDEGEGRVCEETPRPREVTVEQGTREEGGRAPDGPSERERPQRQAEAGRADAKSEPAERERVTAAATATAAAGGGGATTTTAVATAAPAATAAREAASTTPTTPALPSLVHR